jgi:hypothetical protein
MNIWPTHGKTSNKPQAVMNYFLKDNNSGALPPRWLPQCSCVVIESSFDPGERLQAPGSLRSFLRACKIITYRFFCIHVARFLLLCHICDCTFVTGVCKLKRFNNNATALWWPSWWEERDCRTQFWKRTIQWLFRQSLVLIELLVPDKMVFMWISHRVLC